MASARFLAPLLLAAGATAYVQVDLYTPSPKALDTLNTDMERVAYENHPFIGRIPWYPYAMDVDVGTPAQTQSMALTLAHGDSFILYSELCLPSSNPNFTSYVRECSSGAFDDEKSTTFSYNSSDNYYGNYFRAWTEGVMMEDTVSIGNSQLSNASLGIALTTYLDTGFFGLAAPWAFPGGVILEEDTALLDQMADQKIMTSPAFSIHAVEKNETTGNLLFGAVDKSKFDGKLQRIQASASRDKFAGQRNGYKEFVPGYVANVSAVWIADPGAEPEQYASESTFDYEGGPFYAAIDPTFTLTNLPDAVTDALYRKIHPSIWHNIGMRTVECNRADLGHTITLELGGEGGYRLNATMQDLIVPPEVWYLLRPPTENNPESVKHCLFGIQSTKQNLNWHYDNSGDPTPWVIGSLVLKHTYTVFDSRNMEVSLAPLRKNPGDKADIVSFEGYGAHAPDSEFVGYEECFSNCEPEKEDDPDASPHVVVQKGLVIGLVLGALGFFYLR